MDVAEQEAPRLGLWKIVSLPGAGPNGHALHQVTRNGQPLGEPFLFRRAAHNAMMHSVRVEGLAVQERMRRQPKFIRS